MSVSNAKFKGNHAFTLSIEVVAKNMAKKSVLHPVISSITERKSEKNICEMLPLFINDGLGKTRIFAMFMRYCLISSYIKRDIAPLSCMLIAPPEENKTRIMLTFIKFPNAVHPVDVSMKPLRDLIREQDKKQTVYHIIVPDFITTVYHKASVVDAVLGTLLGLLDEGVDENLFFGEVFKLEHKIQMGIITGITPPLFRKHFRKWNENGFITRMFPISYKYSETTCSEISTFISKALPVIINKTISKIKQRGIQEININDDIGSYIKILSEDITLRLRTFYIISTASKKGKTPYKIYFEIQGFRLQKMLRLLCKSITYDRGRNEANYEDLATLRELADLIRLPDNPKEV